MAYVKPTFPTSLVLIRRNIKEMNSNCKKRSFTCRCLIQYKQQYHETLCKVRTFINYLILRRYNNNVCLIFGNCSKVLILNSLGKMPFALIKMKIEILMYNVRIRGQKNFLCIVTFYTNIRMNVCTYMQLSTYEAHTKEANLLNILWGKK